MYGQKQGGEYLHDRIREQISHSRQGGMRSASGDRSIHTTITSSTNNAQFQQQYLDEYFRAVPIDNKSTLKLHNFQTANSNNLEDYYSTTKQKSKQRSHSYVNSSNVSSHNSSKDLQQGMRLIESLEEAQANQSLDITDQIENLHHNYHHHHHHIIHQNQPPILEPRGSIDRIRKPPRQQQILQQHPQQSLHLQRRGIDNVKVNEEVGQQQFRGRTHEMEESDLGGRSAVRSNEESPRALQFVSRPTAQQADKIDVRNSTDQLMEQILANEITPQVIQELVSIIDQCVLEADSTICSLQNSLQEKNEENNNLQQRLLEYQDHFEELHNQYAEKEEEVKRLQGMLEVKSQSSQLTVASSNASRNEDLSHLVKIIESLNEDNKTLKAQVELLLFENQKAIQLACGAKNAKLQRDINSKLLEIQSPLNNQNTSNCTFPNDTFSKNPKLIPSPFAGTSLNPNNISQIQQQQHNNSLNSSMNEILRKFALSESTNQVNGSKLANTASNSSSYSKKTFKYLKPKQS